MPELSTINTSRFRMNETLSYYTKIAAILNELYGEEGSLAEAAFLKALAEYRSSMSKIVEKVSLSDADAQGDEAYMALDYHLRAMVFHPVAENREAAKEVRKIFEKTANPTKLGYSEAYGAIENLLEQLASISDEVISLAHATIWVDKLRKASEYFKELAVKQTDAIANREIGAKHRTRLELQAAWRSYVKRIEVAADDGDPRAISAINRINVLNTKAKKALAARTSKKSAGGNAAAGSNGTAANDDIKFDDM